MITESSMIFYAKKFLDKEISEIKELLNRKSASENDKEILSQLLQQYEQDLQELEAN